MKKIENPEVVCIIPARYASTRFPGKPLALIGSKTMINRVYEQASAAVSMVYVATDDQRIADEVYSFGGKCVMTSQTHLSGTDRCAEAVKIIERESGSNSDVIINIQGDEPFVRQEQISLLADCFTDPAVQIATLIRKVRQEEDIFSPNQPKVVTDINGYAIYFSRSVIPYVTGAEPEEWTKRTTFYKHIGLYAFRRETLDQITRLPPGSLEIAESLEQNRWIQNGFRIKTAVSEWDSIGIDTPEDIERAARYMNQKL